MYIEREGRERERVCAKYQKLMKARPEHTELSNYCPLHPKRQEIKVRSVNES